MTLWGFFPPEKNFATPPSLMLVAATAHAVSQMSYTGADGNLYAVWEMACGMKRLC